MLGKSTKMTIRIVRELATYTNVEERAGKITNAAFIRICATSPQRKRETTFFIQFTAN